MPGRQDAIEVLDHIARAEGTVRVLSMSRCDPSLLPSSRTKATQQRIAISAILGVASSQSSEPLGSDDDLAN